MEKTKKILIVGVGGQGVILASEIFASVAINAGFDVKKSEVHGMAQRGGSVNSHIVFGEKVFSPVIKKGEVDILVSFEELETARYVDYLNKKSILLINKQKVYPPSVLLGKDEYPNNIISTLKKEYKNIKTIDGIGLATKAGNQKSISVVMLGFLSIFLNINKSMWEKELKNKVPAKILKMNKKAFAFGRLEKSK